MGIKSFLPVLCLNLVCHKSISHVNPMNEARIAQYLDLIQRLLSCSGGEQWAILQAQRELWDEESLRTLQRMAG